MSIWNRGNDLFFPHLHLTGAAWDAAQPRDSFDSRVAAVAEHGCTAMGLSQAELTQLLAERPAAELRALLGEHDVRVDELEVLFGWNAEADMRAHAQEIEDNFYLLADAIGATRFKTTAIYLPGQEMPAVDVLTERFGALCDRAAERGVSIALESMAFTPAFNYEVAAKVVDDADRPNGGLLIDAWHLFRGAPGMGALAAVNGKHIVGIELCDATLEMRGDFQDDCVNHRMLPGEGEFALADLMRTLDEKGVDIPLSVEVLSAELRQLSPSENVARTLGAVGSFLDSLRPAL